MNQQKIVASIDVQQIIEIQRQLVIRWHESEIDNPYQENPLIQTICRQHQYNFLLWHQEDIARSPDATDHQIANVKRAIDKYNQQRNDWIEKIDDLITVELESQQIQCPSDAPINTETPGSVIDRLSILALRIFHLQEQLERSDVEQSHLDSVRSKLAICNLQREELSTALQKLLDDIFSGVTRHRTYRQLKMYNDPTLNPYLYELNRQIS